jgi:hypothetical protein
MSELEGWKIIADLSARQSDEEHILFESLAIYKLPILDSGMSGSGSSSVLRPVSRF